MKTLNITLDKDLSNNPKPINVNLGVDELSDFVDLYFSAIETYLKAQADDKIDLSDLALLGSFTMNLMEGLLINQKRYGYLACPCRLASGDREADKDILCPCVYRKPDVEEYGSCYCGLYVTKAWNEGKVETDYIPERRPPEKMGF